MSHTIVALVQDQPGVLSRVVGLFRRRGFNIESLAVGHSETPGLSRLTLVVEAENVEQVVKQLYRLIEVTKVTDLTDQPMVEREMALVKVKAQSAERAEIITVANIFGAKVVDVSAAAMVIEMSGGPSKVDNFIETLRPFGIRELMRTGRVAMARGDRPSKNGGVEAKRTTLSPPALSEEETHGQDSLR
jgi:acetolactate synthase-1/3 small subunit